MRAIPIRSKKDLEQAAKLAAVAIAVLIALAANAHAAITWGWDYHEAEAWVGSDGTDAAHDYVEDVGPAADRCVIAEALADGYGDAYAILCSHISTDPVTGIFTVTVGTTVDPDLDPGDGNYAGGETYFQLGVGVSDQPYALGLVTTGPGAFWVSTYGDQILYPGDDYTVLWGGLDYALPPGSEDFLSGNLTLTLTPVAVVPIPGALLLVNAGVLCLIGFRRKTLGNAAR